MFCAQIFMYYNMSYTQMNVLTYEAWTYEWMNEFHVILYIHVLNMLSTHNIYVWNMSTYEWTNITQILLLNHWVLRLWLLST